MSANKRPTRFTDEDFKRWIKKLRKDTYWACCFDKKNKFEAIIRRLLVAEKVCDEAVSVAYNTATTVGTRTNEGMPKWFLARVKDLDKALTVWWEESGKCG